MRTRGRARIELKYMYIYRRSRFSFRMRSIYVQLLEDNRVRNGRRCFNTGLVIIIIIITATLEFPRHRLVFFFTSTIAYGKKKGKKKFLIEVTDLNHRSANRPYLDRH